jgi:hypothetical protein
MFRKLSIEKIPDSGNVGLGLGLLDGRLNAFLGCWRHGKPCQPNCVAFAISHIDLEGEDVPVIRCRVMEDSNVIGELVPHKEKPSEGKLIEFPGKDKN